MSSRAIVDMLPDAMKIIDRHLFRTLLPPLAACLLAFTMVYVVFDLYNNVGDFLAGKAPIGQIVLFYFMIIPSALVYIVPISLQCAVLYTLSRMTRHNELTAMRACGVSLLRLMAPFVATGIAVSLVVAIVNETAGPWSAYWTRQFIRSQKAQDKMDVYVARNLPFKNERGLRTWIIGRFDTRTCQMQGVEVVQSTREGMDAVKYAADAAAWKDGRWWFSGVTAQEFDEYGYRRGVPRHETAREMTDFDETPRDFLNEIKDPEYLSAVELLDFTAAHRQMSPESVARIMVDFHYRLSLPWTCLTVTLLGIPFGNQAGRRGVFVGILLSLSLFFALYVVIHFGLWLGKERFIPAWLAGWAANLLFLTAGGILTFRMR